MCKNKTVAAIGKFDGFHIGHRELIRTAVQKAEQLNISSLIYFIGSQESCLMSQSDIDDLTTEYGVDMCIRQPLTEDFKNLDAKSFVRDILLEELGCAVVVVGYNFRFAKGRSAGTHELKNLCNEYGIECIVIDEIRCEELNIPVSSSNVRKLLSDGRVEDVSTLLSRLYSICGTVVRGKQIGRTIGFPTANLESSTPYVLPKEGVYATRSYVGSDVYGSVTNIGKNPTVSGDKITIETHIMDFDEYIYGSEIRIEFVKKIRDEKKFVSLKELETQIKQDKITAKNLVVSDTERG